MAHGGGDRHGNGSELLTALFMPVPGRGGGRYLAKYPLAVKYLLAVSHSLHTRPRTGGVRYV